MGSNEDIRYFCFKGDWQNGLYLRHFCLPPDYYHFMPVVVVDRLSTLGGFNGGFSGYKYHISFADTARWSVSGDLLLKEFSFDKFLLGQSQCPVCYRAKPEHFISIVNKLTGSAYSVDS